MIFVVVVLFKILELNFLVNWYIGIYSFKIGLLLVFV